MRKEWIYKNIPSENIVNTLSQDLNIDKTLATLLAQRQVCNFAQAKAFFRPSLDEHLHDPFLMKDMDKAVERISQAITKQEKILIYGDYDVDGTTAVALVYSFLSESYQNLDFYIPDRYEEGYGISKKAIDWAKAEKFQLIIALDCGIKAHDLVSYASSLDIDFIICDHHLPSKKVPQAVAVLDPKRQDCKYPYKELSGCGVGFKLMQAYTLKQGISQEKLYNTLDLLAVSIASDLVHMTGENRVLAYFGLKKLNENPQCGLKALLEVSGFTERGQTLSIRQVVFNIGPKINAVGRLSHAKEAVKLLTEKDGDKAKQQAENIKRINTQRQNIDSDTVEEALEIIAEHEKQGKVLQSTVLYREHWHKGILGIVASRCIEHYYRPTLILSGNNGILTGSGRSIRNFDLYGALVECQDLLEGFGGHRQAAGMTLKQENLEAFRERFEEVVRKKLQDKVQIEPILIDSKLRLEQITPKFFRVMKQFSPFGPENMRPVFVSKHLKAFDLKIVGGKHLSFKVKEKSSNFKFSVIAFGMAKLYKRVKFSKYIRLAYTIEDNTYRGKTSLQLNVKDVSHMPHS